MSLQGVFFLSPGGSWGLKAQPCSPEGENSLHAEVPGSASLSSHLLPTLLSAGLRWPLFSVPRPQRVTVCLLIHHWCSDGKDVGGTGTSGTGLPG